MPSDIDLNSSSTAFVSQRSQNMAHEFYRDKYKWRLLKNTEEDVVQYCDLFKINGDPKKIDILRWRLSFSDPCENIILLAEDCSGKAEKPAALSVLLKTIFRIDNNLLRCAQAVDSLTDARHRGQGLFIWLAAESYELLANRGGHFVWGFPNPNLKDAYPKHLQWSMLNPTPFIIRPMRSGYFLDALLRRLGFARSDKRWLDYSLGRFARGSAAGIELRPLSSFGEAHDELWARFSNGIRVCVDRTAAYMNWRVFAHPEGKYRVLGAYRSGRLVAEVIWCLDLKHGGRIGYILELLVDPDDRAAGRAALSAALSELAASRADAVLAWNVNDPPNASVYRRAGFLPLPERLRPSNIYWGVRCLDDSIAPIVRERANWYISYTDSDTT